MALVDSLPFAFERMILRIEKSKDKDLQELKRQYIYSNLDKYPKYRECDPWKFMYEPFPEELKKTEEYKIIVKKYDSEIEEFQLQITNLLKKMETHRLP